MNQRGEIPIITGVVMFFASVFATFTGHSLVQQNTSPPQIATTQNATQQAVNASITCTPANVTLSISGSVPAPTNGDNVWTTVTDEKASQTVVVELVGQGGIGGPGTSVNVNANFIDYAGSIRGQGSLQIFCDGRTYTVKVYNAPFTNGIPQLATPIAQAAASQAVVTPSPSPVPTYSPLPSASPVSGTTKTGWSFSGNGVDVIPYTRSDKHALFLDFESPTFDNIESIYYNLNYDTDEDATLRGGQGTLYPVSDKPNGYDSQTNKLYIRREVVFGTCSKKCCNYERNPRNFRLTVTTKYKNSDTKYTKTLNDTYSALVI